MPSAGASRLPDLIKPTMVLRAKSTGAVLSEDGRELRVWSDPLDALRWLPGSWRDRVLGTDERWIGYLSYDLGRYFEHLPDIPADTLRAPLFVFGARGQSTTQHASPVVSTQGAQLQPSLSRTEYLTAVQRVLDYISAGDVFQVNLARSLVVPTNRSASEIYSHLTRTFPADYGCLLEFADFAIISNSPELYVKVTPDRRITTRPIKGTSPRAPGMKEQLQGSIKDQAELAMIVDLERNDFGRICTTGSVKVVEARVIEELPTVYHGVATIEGTLRDEVTFIDILRATFPGGSVTGAPKIRAMQIIDELEPVARGPYCGAMGYIASDGTMELNIAIRTMILKDGMAHFAVGGGIVADSNPLAEFEETIVKARAMAEALGITEHELRAL